MIDHKHPNNTLLLILDGLGLNNDPNVSATTGEQMPFLHELMQENGYAQLEASETAVGLDTGQAGNSEVGHMTIGAGRKLVPTLERIRNAYDNGEWANSLCWPKEKNTLHIVGLVSDAGIHGHWTTICMAAELAENKGYEQIYIHALLDGVDSQAGSAIQLLQLMKENLPKQNVALASVMGRKWASDRSGDWSVTQHCADALMDWSNAQEFSSNALSDHLLKQPSEANFPRTYCAGGQPIQPGDTVLLTSHRADRISQLAKVFQATNSVLAMVELKHESVPLERVFFPTQSLEGGLIDILKQMQVPTFRLSENCKFPHVTYFINGMKTDDTAELCEVDTLPDSELIAHPEMSIKNLAGHLEARIGSNVNNQLTIVNVPNLDQIGHQGDFKAACSAAKIVDEFLKNTVNWCRTHGWNILITADHGNADVMKDEQRRPLGSHSTNPVPMLALRFNGQVNWLENHGCLTNVAASLLTIMGLAEAIPNHWDPALIQISNNVSSDPLGKS